MLQRGPRVSSNADGGIGVSYTVGIRMFNGRGEIIPGLIAGAGVLCIVAGIVLAKSSESRFAVESTKPDIDVRLFFMSVL
jgi:hypothetical protein